MMRRKLLLFPLITSLTILLNAAIADNDHTEARRLLEAGSIQPLEAIIESVKKQYTGRILEVEFEQEDGRYIYEIELLDATGVVREMEFDAMTGELIQTERGK